MIDSQTSAQIQVLSSLAHELKGSEIIKLAGEIKEKIAAGQEVYNFTIGDFDPGVFPIPEELENLIVKAYRNKETNYPASNGIAELREAISEHLSKEQGLSYSPDQILVSGGARPLIYGAYQVVLNPGENALFPVPSWNNNHYTTLTKGNQIAIETRPENHFMPTAEDIEPHIKNAGLLALCSPLNPTGTVFTPEGLKAICDLVIAENRSRQGNRKPLYVIYDQIYSKLCYNNTYHCDPVSLAPEMRPYTIYVDGISKAYAATGVRVGWAFGPGEVIGKMKSILGHVGAWAPKPEQFATAEFLTANSSASAFLSEFKDQLIQRLRGFYKIFKELKELGFPVDVIVPQAAIYLTVYIDLRGKKRKDGMEISSVEETTSYLIDEAGVALVPFSAFGASKTSPWYRLSVGTSKMEDIEDVGRRLKQAIEKLD
jgi:aspartate aminotransferase